MQMTFDPLLLSKNPKVEILKDTITNHGYLKDRETFWESRIEIAQQSGKDLWNSKVIFFHQVNCIDDNEMIFEFRLGEYKDFLFQSEVGRRGIAEKYGKDTLLNHVGIEALVITNDNHLVFGIRNSRTFLEPGALCPVTGTLSINEQEIRSFKDIVTYMGKEISEEINVNFDREKLTFHSLNFCSRYYAFTFLYRLEISASEAKDLYNKGEYDGTIVLTKDAFLNYDKAMIASLKVYQKQINAIL